jgi:glutamate dehydrogenase/leucine dehydrogenase
MSTATNEVCEVAESKQLDLRTAAYVLALNKLDEYYLVRGIDLI